MKALMLSTQVLNKNSFECALSEPLTPQATGCVRVSVSCIIHVAAFYALQQQSFLPTEFFKLVTIPSLSFAALHCQTNRPTTTPLRGCETECNVSHVSVVICCWRIRSLLVHSSVLKHIINVIHGIIISNVNTISTSKESFVQ